mmetsp:Transcript_18946/g.58553  ORF Transcript_18946/g.58553 Transcript_18946/m.58553 type:complete len:305 (+) Transcript_18946:210-1124(+)
MTWDARRDAAATTPVARWDRRSAQASEPARTRKATRPSSNAATAAHGASGSGANVNKESVGASPGGAKSFESTFFVSCKDGRARSSTLCDVTTTSTSPSGPQTCAEQTFEATHASPMQPPFTSCTSRSVEGPTGRAKATNASGPLSPTAIAGDVDGREATSSRNKAPSRNEWTNVRPSTAFVTQTPSSLDSTPATTAASWPRKTTSARRRSRALRGQGRDARSTRQTPARPSAAPTSIDTSRAGGAPAAGSAPIRSPSPSPHFTSVKSQSKHTTEASPQGLARTSTASWPSSPRSSCVTRKAPT